ncbi:MAG: multicopper oxidase domain-containing protein [Chloroflexota bacterium]
MQRSRIIGLLAAAALVATACAPSGGAPTWTYTPGGANGATPAPSSPENAGGEVLGTLDVEAVDLAFKPADLTEAKAGTYEIKLTNNGAIQHDITFADGTTSGLVDPGQSKTVKVNVPDGGLTFICSIPGHAAAGMKGGVTVAGSTAGGGDHGGPAPATDVKADPNAPAYTLYPAEAPKVLPGTVHDIDLYIQEKLMTVAEGFVQKVWAFGTTPDNATVPGPVIRVHLGDTVNVRLINPAVNELPHSVDFHASQVAWNDEMTSIKPGEEKLYSFTADYAGVWMYHCGTSPTLHHIANGMYGMLIVEPKGGYAPVDTELAIVQSEWYLGPQGDITSLEKASTGNPAPDFVVFNGVANQYLDNPIKTPTNGRVRIFLLDTGPSIDSSFHIVGTIFDTVTKEGIQLLKGNAGGWGSQAVDLSPAQGAIIELSPKEDGLYPIVTHAFNFVGRGALGLLQAGDGDPKN